MLSINQAQSLQTKEKEKACDWWGNVEEQALYKSHGWGGDLMAPNGL